MKLDVVFTLAGDIRWNSRALKQLAVFEEMGLHVLAVGIGETYSEEKRSEQLTVRTLKRPEGKGPRFFRAVHLLMKAQITQHAAKIYHASDLYTLPAAAGAAGQGGSSLVYDARELYPFVASTAGRPWVSWVWRMVEKRYITRADNVFTVSKSIAEHMARSYAIAAPTVLYNVPEYKAVSPTKKLQNLLGIASETKIILHQGNIQKNRGCFILADAMKHINGGVLVFLGGGPLKGALQTYVRDLGIEEKIIFLPPVPPDELLVHTASAFVGVTLLEDTCLNHRYALPNKLFEYLMAGIPVVASDLPEIRNVIQAYNVGVLVDASKPEAVAEGINRIINEPGLREQRSANIPLVFETFSWKNASQELKHRYQDILSQTISQ